MTQIPAEAFVEMSEDRKNQLDDLPDSMVEYLFSLKESTIVETDSVTFPSPDGIGQITLTFQYGELLECMDYLEYLMQNGYRPVVSTYEGASNE